LISRRVASRLAARPVRGTQDSIDRSNTFSEVVLHGPCFDISRGRPVSLIVREGAVSKDSPGRPAAWKTGFRWLRETYLRYRREGRTIAETGALSGFVSSRAAVWEADVGAAIGTTFESTLRRR
jgi:hypothetical protein